MSFCVFLLCRNFSLNSVNFLWRAELLPIITVLRNTVLRNSCCTPPTEVPYFLVYVGTVYDTSSEGTVFDWWLRIFYIII